MQESDQLVEKLLSSLSNPSNKDSFASKEVIVRFVAHMCFCKSEVLSSDVLAKAIRAVRWMITKPQKTLEEEKK